MNSTPSTAITTPHQSHTVRVFPIGDGSKHVASCACGNTRTSTDPAEAVRDLIFDGCFKNTVHVEADTPGD